MSEPHPSPPASGRTIRWLTYLMFMMFAMTTDSVGVIIPEVIREFDLSLTAAGSFHYASMIAIAISGVFLGFLADRLGPRRTIILGLGLFAVASGLFAAGNSFAFFLVLLVASGLAIGVFKTGALALIGDISRDTRDHTATMNAVEGFFGVGAILGPAIVAALLAQGASWKLLYVFAAGLSLALLAVAAFTRYPHRENRPAGEKLDLVASLRLLADPHASLFAWGLGLYVAVECAIYVWMPTLLADYTGSARSLVGYALPVFFVLRAAGRFLGAWLLRRWDWAAVLALFGGAIFLCFLGGVVGGIEAAIYLLPLSGLFMSVIYPTLNSKGISCVPKTRHGAAAGLNLFLSCLGAAAGPLAMGAVGDAFGGARHGFVLATFFAALLAGGLVWNWRRAPARRALADREIADYQTAST